jgi:Cd2+/Zn2+-exporting ATPase
VENEAGADIFAGSKNGHGAQTIRVTAHADDTTLARIIHAVEEAQASRAPTQSFVDRFARVYTPVVVGLALVVAVLPPLLGADWGTWIYRSLTMLVIACPCALVISTPVTIVSALAGAARQGVIIKGGAYLEGAGSLDTVVFDKTGTLTEGRPAVTDIVSLDGRDEAAILRLAAAVEQHSEHPLAQAVLAAARERDLTLPAVRDFEALAGRGARALVDGQVVALGNHRLSREMGYDTPAADAALATLEAHGRTAFLLMNGAGAVGIIAMADSVRPEALASIQALRHAGVRRIIMLTGDNEGTARAVAQGLGIEEYRSGLLPSEKADFVRELVSSGEYVAVVGDGVNDAPALASATVGVAMGAAGSDVALETADVALMGDDLSKLAGTIQLSRKALAIIKQNITFAIATKAVFLILAAIGWATLWMAVAADMGASLAVVGNGLRALRAKA